MKKLINDIPQVVPQLLEGLALSTPDIVLVAGQTIALRADVAALQARGEVALISGGGAGHEPAHAGYVGAGMLTAAVVGDVFTSPSADAVLTAIEAVAGPGGVLLIVKNYTGDRLNFGLAAEIARSRGIAVDMVVVADDVALAANGDHAGRRGVAGTVFVHKLAGAAAASGATLEQVRQVALQAIAQVGTMGVGLSACTVPAAGKPGFSLADTEVELGLGIHGESGVRRVALQPVDGLVDTLLSTIVADAQLAPGARVALLVNNLGATPPMELSIVLGRALQWLQQRGLVVERAWSGSFLTALDMAGVSLSLLRLDDDLLQALDAPTRAPAWPAAHLGRVANAGIHTAAPVGSAAAAAEQRTAPDAAVAHVIEQVCQALLDAEDELTRLDQVVGDGDLGISLARGARALLSEMTDVAQNHVPATLRAMSATLRRALGGTSGPLYAIGLLRAAAALPQDGAALTAPTVAQALQAAVDAIMAVGGAQPGDRTMLDAMVPATQALASATDLATGLRAAVDAARAGAQATAQGVARRGRASYLGERAIGHPDPGACAVVVWLEVLAAQASAA